MCSPKRERRALRIYGVIETEDDVLQIVRKDWSEFVIPQPAPEQDNEPPKRPQKRKRPSADREKGRLLFAGRGSVSARKTKSSTAPAPPAVPQAADEGGQGLLNSEPGPLRGK
jgi:hypothetical protein